MTSKVPAVLYGHGTDPRHISLPGHELMLALKTSNVLLTLDIDGKDELALPKDIQRDPIKGFLEHVDLVVVRRGEKVTVEIGVHLVGEAAPDTFVTTEHELPGGRGRGHPHPDRRRRLHRGTPGRRADPRQGHQLPDGTTLVTDPEALVVNVTAATTAEEIEAELAEAEAEVGIVHEPTDEEQAAQAEAAAEGGDDSAAAAGDAEGDKADS